MTLASAGSIVAAAVGSGRAVPAFNVITLEHAEAVTAGAADAGISVLLQVSENAIKYHGGFAPLLLACRELAVESATPIGIHVDHVQDTALALAIIRRAERLGVGSIMFDGAALGFDENVATTAEITRAAHESGLWVEGELGEVGGKGGAHAPNVRTDPIEARDFVLATGVDALAVAVGSEHAMTDRSAKLDLSLIGRIGAVVPVPLVLHGSSGVADDILVAAAACGMRKINIGTALLVASTLRLRTDLAAMPEAVDPRLYTRGARDDMRALVAHFARLIGATRPEST